MISFKTYPAEVVHQAMDDSKTTKCFLPDGRVFRKNNQRLVTFKKSQKCSKCGLEGSYYSLESHSKNVKPHLNFYALNADSQPVLMTKDHTVPKSKGGPSSLNNYTTMCSPCNTAKADKDPEDDE